MRGWIEVLALRRVLFRCLVSFVLVAMMVSAVYAQPPPTLLWSDPVNTLDIAVSKNGQYVASVVPLAESGEVRFYDRNPQDPKSPLWTWSTGEDLYSVAISADGDSVVAGGNTHVFFWKNARSLTDTDPTWISVDLDGPIGRRCLDISDDGNYVAAADCLGLLTIYYWAGARSRSSNSELPTWWGGNAAFTSIDMSSDGNYIAIGVIIPGNEDGVSYAVAYLKNTRTLTGEVQNADWISQVDGLVVDVAISDDGNYVAAATGPGAPATVHYWAGAKSLSGEQSDSTWWGGVDVFFTSIDMSCDGDSVIAGAFQGVYFWDGARGMTGKPQQETWAYGTSVPEFHVADVAINDAGTYMAAATGGFFTAYFFDSSEVLKWSHPLGENEATSSISISCDGGTLAVGTQGGVITTTAYLFDTGFSDPCCGAAPVGGVLTAVDRLAVLTPYLALLGVIAVVTVAVAISRKKPKN